MWTSLRKIRREPERIKDLVVRRYREPIFEFALRQGLSPEDAEDVAQEVFFRVCREEFLERADEKKGRFRTLLLAVLNHVVASLRRHRLAGIRDRRREIPLEDIEVPAEDPEFDRLWVRTLVRRALERLGDDPGARALRMQMEGTAYREIAATLGKKETDVTNYVHRAKGKLRREIERLIGEYSTEEEARVEITTLLRYL